LDLSSDDEKTEILPSSEPVEETKIVSVDDQMDQKGEAESNQIPKVLNSETQNVDENGTSKEEQIVESTDEAPLLSKLLNSENMKPSLQNVAKSVPLRDATTGDASPSDATTKSLQDKIVKKEDIKALHRAAYMEYQEKLKAIQDELIETQKVLGVTFDDLDDDEETPPADDPLEDEDEDGQEEIKPVKPVNMEFVEGLDGIRKFMEEVDPPDELDVGAAGSSIQDVLMGQGAHIVKKQIVQSLDNTKKNIVKFTEDIRDKIRNVLKLDEIRDGVPFAGGLVLVTKTTKIKVGKALQGIWKICQRLVKRLHETMDDMGWEQEEDAEFNFHERYGEGMKGLDDIRRKVEAVRSKQSTEKMKT